MDMGVFIDRDTPKMDALYRIILLESMIGGTPIFGNHQIWFMADLSVIYSWRFMIWIVLDTIIHLSCMYIYIYIYT